MPEDPRYGPGGYKVTSSGTNSQGNRYDTRQGSDGSKGYHYSNKDGSYYYKNPDNSSYYRSGDGSYSTFTAPDGSVYTK